MSLPGLFVTGTDTGVGKTRIACAIVRSLIGEGRRVGAMKPIASSGELQEDASLISPDTAELLAALGDTAELPPDRITPFVYPGDVAPSVAMRFSRGRDSASLVAITRATREGLAWWGSRADVMVIEGVGGLLCPIAEGAVVADLAVALDFPLLIVARRGLGTLNHTLLTVEAARRRGLRLAGVVLNGSEPTTNPLAESTNPDELARFLGDVPILADLSHEPGHARPIGLHGVDWIGRAKPSRLVPSPSS